MSLLKDPTASPNHLCMRLFMPVELRGIFGNATQIPKKKKIKNSDVASPHSVATASKGVTVQPESPEKDMGYMSNRQPRFVENRTPEMPCPLRCEEIKRSRKLTVQVDK